MNWRNIPMPLEHMGPVALGVIVNRSRPTPIFGAPLVGQVIGWPLLAAGLVLIAWAIRNVDDILVHDPQKLVTGGAYARSRNPMYVAWTLIDLSAALFTNSWLPILLLPVVLVFMHLWVLWEEGKLEQRFDEEYRQYVQRVRRYV